MIVPSYCRCLGDHDRKQSANRTTREPHIAEVAVLSLMCTHLDGHSVPPLSGGDAVVLIVVNLVVVYGQEVAVVVRVKAVDGVVVHLVSAPVSLLVYIRVDSDVVVLRVRVMDVSVDADVVELPPGCVDPCRAPETVHTRGVRGCLGVLHNPRLAANARSTSCGRQRRGERQETVQRSSSMCRIDSKRGVCDTVALPTYAPTCCALSMAFVRRLPLRRDSIDAVSISHCAHINAAE